MPANYLQAFRGPDLAGIDRAAYSNALLRNDVQRLPQRNAAEDFAYKADQELHQQNISEAQRNNAIGTLGRGFATLANAPPGRLKEATRAFLASQEFQSAGKIAGLPVEQFSYDDNDDENTMRQQLAAYAQAMEGKIAGQGGNAPKFGVTPQFGVDAQGNAVPIQFNDQGGAQVTQLPEGVKLSRTPIRMDAGTEWIILDPITRQVVGREPKNVAGAEAEKGIGDWLGKSYAEIQETGMSAGQTLARLDRLEELSKNIETGRLAGAKKTIAEYAQALGVEVEGLDETQAFQALTNQLALEMRNPGGGAGMPGAMSDQDREFLLRTVPNLVNTPGGNQQIIDFSRALARRSQQVAARAREYKRRTGKMDEGFFDELSQWSSSNPLFNGGGQRGASFANEQEAAAAAAAGKIKPGDRITVGGQSGVWQ